MNPRRRGSIWVDRYGGVGMSGKRGGRARWVEVGWSTVEGGGVQEGGGCWKVH